MCMLIASLISAVGTGARLMCMLIASLISAVGTGARLMCMLIASLMSAVGTGAPDGISECMMIASLIRLRSAPDGISDRLRLNVSSASRTASLIAPVIGSIIRFARGIVTATA
jgi:hypothetical protein